MERLSRCAAGLCSFRHRHVGHHGHFGEGLAEVEVKEENRFVPDRLILADSGPGWQP